MTAIKSTDLRAHNNEVVIEITSLLEQDRNGSLDRLGRAHVGLLLGEINELRKGRGLNRLAEASEGDCNA